MTIQAPDKPIQAPDGRIRGAISALLDQLNITRIVVVDDDLDKAGDENTLIRVKTHVAVMRPQLSKLAEKHGMDELIEDVRDTSEFGEEIRDDISLLWARLSIDEKLTLGALIPDSGDEINNLAALDAIKPFLPARICYLPLSVVEWKATCDDLFAEGHPHTLVFFDRQLSEGLGGKHGGDLLVQQLHSRDRTGRVLRASHPRRNGFGRRDPDLRRTAAPRQRCRPRHWQVPDPLS